MTLVSGKEYSLHAGDILIYIIYLPDFFEFKSNLSQFLNAPEIKKAKRFYKEIDKNRFIIYRSILKLLLGAYTKSDAKKIYLDYDFNKKPYLASHPWLHFNISHSEDYAAIAVSRKMIGLDIEYLSKDFKFTDLLPDIFDDHEREIIQNTDDKQNAFYTLWTRKEAFVKALGKGIDEDFKYIPSTDGQHNLEFKRVKNTQNWQVHSFDFADHYMGAVAFEGLPTVSNHLLLCNVPNSLESLLEMTYRRK